MIAGAVAAGLIAGLYLAWISWPGVGAVAAC